LHEFFDYPVELLRVIDEQRMTVAVESL